MARSPPSVGLHYGLVIKNTPLSKIGVTQFSVVFIAKPQGVRKYTQKEMSSVRLPWWSSLGTLKLAIHLQWWAGQSSWRPFSLSVSLIWHELCVLINSMTSTWNRGWFPHLGPDSIQRCHLTSIGNPIVEIRRSLRSSYLHNGISYTGKMISLHWIRIQYFWLHCL